MLKREPDPVMKTAKQLFDLSGKTLEELGEGMGYAPDMARKSAWQFLNMTADPRLSMLRKFATALGIPVESLFSNRPPKPAKK
jgi:transcriptional regulator with XRE-family HTH domain